MNIAALTGPSGSGKTTLIAKLIAHYLGQGHSVGAIKHTHHPINDERRGDTQVFLDAGAMPVIFAGDGEAVVFRASSIERIEFESPRDLLAHFDTDLVLIEGFKDCDAWPRIEARGRSVEEVASILDRIWRS